MQTNKPEWTIGIVNYNSVVYLKWQFKILFELNDPHSFKLIIVDNSNPHQKQELNELVAEYNQLLNIEVIYHSPIEKSASGQHGEGLNLIQDKTTTEYFLVHDPDFFWVQPGYLDILKQYLEVKDHAAIGAPYPNKVGGGDPWFPSAYGCAYKTRDLKNANFSALVTEKKRLESFRKYPPKKGYEYSFDVGWQIRCKLSKKLFCSFEQREAYELKTLIGIHSFEAISKEYFYKGASIAFHLFRGTFSGSVTADHRDPQQEIARLWLETRDKYGHFFYSYAKRDLNSGIIYKKRILQILMFFPNIFSKCLNKILLLRRHPLHYYRLVMHKYGMQVAIIKILKKTPFGTQVIKYLKKLKKSLN